MDLKWLEDFLSLVNTRNFSEAAAERFISQPAFSRRIKSLEQWLNVPLVDRSTYPPQLTAEGEKFRAFAEETVRFLYETRADLQGKNKSDTPTMSFALQTTLATNFFPAWLKRIEGSVGSVSLRVVSGPVLDCTQMLLSGAADFMMIYWHPGATVQLDPAVYHSRVVGHDRFLPVAAADAKGQPIFRQPGGPQERLPFLAYTPDAQLSRVTGSILRRQGAAAFLEPVCVNSMALILKAMAMAGHGVAWLPRACIEEELAAKVLAVAGGRIWHSALEIRLFQPIAATGETSRRIWAATEDDVAIEGPEELA